SACARTPTRCWWSRSTAAPASSPARRSASASTATACATSIPTPGSPASLRPSSSMPYTVDFHSVSTVGLESSAVADALAGLRANEARYFKNKYDHVFTVQPADEAQGTIDWVHRILKEERDIVIASRPLEATAFQVENIR